MVIEPRCTISMGSITSNHTLHPLELSGCDTPRGTLSDKGEGVGASEGGLDLVFIFY